MLQKYALPIVLLAIILYGCGKKAPREETASPSAPIVSVKARPIMKGSIENVLTVEGQSDARQQEKVVSPIAGIILSIVEIPGTPIRPGEQVARIISRESQAAISGARRLLLDAKTDVQKEDARRSLDLAQASKSIAVLRARIGGALASRSVTVGQLIAENTELLTIVDPASIYFGVAIPLKDVSRVRPGQPCRIRFPSLPGFKVGAEVKAIAPEADSQSQSVRATLSIPGLPPSDYLRLKTDMFGAADIVTGVHKNALLVPTAALLRNDEENTVSIVVVAPGSIAKTINVQVGIANDSLAEITGSDVHEGDMVITEGNYALADSTKVRITE